MPPLFFRIAAALCFLAVALGAFGAHGLKGVLQANGTVEIWEKAVLYHLTHAIALIALALHAGTNRGAFYLLLAGIISASSLSLAILKASQGTTAPTPPVITAAREQQLFQQFCYACHSERAKAAGIDSASKLTLDTLDTANVHRDAKTWELVLLVVRSVETITPPRIVWASLSL